jgi:EmrB/QacA subfamily drug resistance transporter
VRLSGLGAGARPRIDDSNRRWWILAATGGSLAIVALDEVLVGVALPTIRDELGMSQLLSQWVVGAYVLALTVSVAAAGRLGDLIGHRPMFIAGAAILVVGSVAAGLAQGSASMIAARAVQGLGSAAIFSLGVAMTGIAFPERQRGVAFGIYGLVGASASATAPFLGGLLTDTVSWRGIFFVTVPLIIAVSVILALAWREPERSTPRPAFDARGLALLLLFLVPLVVALMQAPDWGWGSAAVIALLALAAIALPLFVRVEQRAEDPLIEIDLLRRATLIGADLVYFCGQFAKITVLVFGALYLQDRLGMSPLVAGVALLAATLPLVMTAIWAGRLTDRHGPRLPMLIGVTAMTAGLAWLAIFVPGESYPLLLPGLVLWGLSLAFFYTPPQTALMNAVAATQRGEVAGVAATGRMLGGVLAVAVLGGVLVATDSYSAVFWLGAAVTAAVWVGAFLLVERPGHRCGALGAE